MTHLRLVESISAIAVSGLLVGSTTGIGDSLKMEVLQFPLSLTHTFIRYIYT